MVGADVEDNAYVGIVDVDKEDVNGSSIVVSIVSVLDMTVSIDTSKLISYYWTQNHIYTCIIMLLVLTHYPAVHVSPQ